MTDAQKLARKSSFTVWGKAKGAVMAMDVRLLMDDQFRCCVPNDFVSYDGCSYSGR